MAFGAEIKRLREDARISVQKIADKIGVDAGRWRKWEEKDLTPREEDVLKIESFFGMDIGKIIALKSIKKFLNVQNGHNNLDGDSSSGLPTSILITKDLGKTIGNIEEKLLRLEATVTILSITLAETIAKITGKTIAGISVEISKAIDEEADRLYGELHKKSRSES